MFQCLTQGHYRVRARQSWLLTRIESVSWETKPILKDAPFAVEHSVRVYEDDLKNDRVIFENPVRGRSRISI